MKQKIVIKLQMGCEKCRVKALSIGAVAKGVNSLAIEGADKDLLVVICEGVDPTHLICKLRKKLCCYVTLISVEEVKPPKKPEVKPPPPPPPPPPCCSCSQFVICHCHQNPQFPKCCQAVCDENPSCSIM